MTVQEKIKSHPDVADYFKELPFYNKYIEKPKIKRLKKLIYFLNFLFMKFLQLKDMQCNAKSS